MATTTPDRSTSRRGRRLLLLLFLLLVVSDVTALAAGRSPEEDALIRICGTPTECVKVVAATRISIIIDELNLSKDSVARVVDRIPTWFGPQERPVTLELNGKRFDPRQPLAEQGVSVGMELRLVSVKEPPQQSPPHDASQSSNGDL